jgi:CrcB protein
VTVTAVIGVALLGGLGAVARFVLDGLVSSRLGAGFPWGTLAINISGAFLLGLLVGAAIGDPALLLLGTGLLGAYTTFSTWMFEAHRLGEDGQLRRLASYIAVSLALGLGAAGLGRMLGAAL